MVFAPAPGGSRRLGLRDQNSSIKVQQPLSARLLTSHAAADALLVHSGREATYGCPDVGLSHLPHSLRFRPRVFGFQRKCEGRMRGERGVWNLRAPSAPCAASRTCEAPTTCSDPAGLLARTKQFTITTERGLMSPRVPQDACRWIAKADLPHERPVATLCSVPGQITGCM